MKKLLVVLMMLVGTFCYAGETVQIDEIPKEYQGVWFGKFTAEPTEWKIRPLQNNLFCTMYSDTIIHNNGESWTVEKVGQYTDSEGIVKTMIIFKESPIKVWILSSSIEGMKFLSIIDTSKEIELIRLWFKVAQ